MKRFVRFWKVIVFDTLGVIFILAAFLTGWLPGPGGIPLFIIGLSLIAVHHEWAKRYIELAKRYADKLGDIIFVRKPSVQLAYDIAAPFGIIAGVYLLVRHAAVWQIGVGVFLVCIGVVMLLGNRQRWQRFRHKQ